MSIEYFYDRRITPAQFIGVLRRSTLSERRPVDDLGRISDMLANANLICTAWDSDVLVGVSRSVTDFSYCCYLSDLAVDTAYQKKGIGKRLVEVTQSRLHPLCKIILLSAPKAEGYYPKIGFRHFHSAWILPAKEPPGTSTDSTPAAPHRNT
ncbi:MAG TPA: GNAT family N-acetyltransferase [Verrucomicrobiae bacterium]|jgi:GNAT superfamily N-acetyltransferase